MAGVAAIEAGLSTDQRRMLRLAFGVTLAVALAYAIEWPIAFLTTVLVAKFLSAPTPRLSFQAGLAIVISIGAAAVTGMLVVFTVLPFMAVALPFMAVLLFWIFLLNARGVSPFLVLMLLIGATIIPLLGLNSAKLAQSFSIGFVVSGVIAVLLVWVAFVCVPDRGDRVSEIVPPVLPEKSLYAQLRLALLSTSIVMPIIVLFYTLNITGAALVMVFIAIMALQPLVQATLTGGAMMILGNTAGGIVAIALYNLIAAVPSYSFLIMLVSLFSLVLARQIFSGRKFAPVYAGALTTMLVLLGSSTGTFGEEAYVNFYLRIAQIMLATVYMAGASVLVYHLLPKND